MGKYGNSPTGNMTCMLIGLTGGIASGKSTVARLWEARGAVLIDSDVIAREVVAPGTPGLAEITERFGTEVITADGSLDRPALGAIVFSDPQARADLEAITHPRVLARTRELISAAGADRLVVHDIPLLVELNRADEYDLVVVVSAPVEDRVARMVRDRGMTQEQARARIAAQATDEQRRAVADVWLENDSTPAALEAEAVRVWQRFSVPDPR